MATYFPSLLQSLFFLFGERGGVSPWEFLETKALRFAMKPLYQEHSNARRTETTTHGPRHFLFITLWALLKEHQRALPEAYRRLRYDLAAWLCETHFKTILANPLVARVPLCLAVNSENDGYAPEPHFVCVHTRGAGSKDVNIVVGLN